MKTFKIEVDEDECETHGDILVREFTDGEESGGRFFDNLEEAEQYVDKFMRCQSYPQTLQNGNEKS